MRHLVAPPSNCTLINSALNSYICILLPGTYVSWTFSSLDLLLFCIQFLFYFFAFYILCFCVVSSSCYMYTLPCRFSHCSVAYSCMLQCLPTDLLIPLVPVTNHVKFGQVGIVTVNFGLQLNGHNNTTRLGFTHSDFRIWNFAIQTCSCKCDFLCTWYTYIEMIPRCILF